MQRRINPREANRMMQRMGMQVKQIDDVSRVIIESTGKKIIIEGPEVSVVTVQGQTIYQVGGGKSREEAPPVATSADDAKLVAGQAGSSVEDAARALQQTGGDLAQAILLLKQQQKKTP